MLGRLNQKHAEAMALLSFTFPGVFQSMDLNAKTLGWRATETSGWNASLSQPSLLTDLQLAIQLNCNFFSAIVFHLVHKNIMGDFVLGLVHL